MDNKLQLFDNPEFGKVRAVELGGEPWFVGKDVAVALGYKNPRQGIASNVDDEDRGRPCGGLPLRDARNDHY